MVETCEICGTTEEIQEHHISYNPEIKQFLCVTCHQKKHGHGVGKAKGWTTKLSELLRIDAKMLFKRGATNKEVANACNISPVTASHWRNKLGLGLPAWTPKTPKTEEEIEQEILKTIHRRGIYRVQAYLTFLHDQKITKRDVAKARTIKIDEEIRVIDRMLEAEDISNA